jgi:hypothetical protein
MNVCIYEQQPSDFRCPVVCCLCPGRMTPLFGGWEALSSIGVFDSLSKIYNGRKIYLFYLWDCGLDSRCENITLVWKEWIHVPSGTRAKISHLVASSTNKPSTVVFALLVPSCQQVWNKLLTTCNNLVDIIRLVARLFQQVWYSHDITILLQPCVVNLVTFLSYHHDCIRLEACYKLRAACSKLVQLVNRLVTSCLQTCNNCNNLCIFTCVRTACS